jgi:hypothetical protein
MRPRATARKERGTPSLRRAGRTDQPRPAALPNRALVSLVALVALLALVSLVSLVALVAKARPRGRWAQASLLVPGPSGEGRRSQAGEAAAAAAATAATAAAAGMEVSEEGGRRHSRRTCRRHLCLQRMRRRRRRARARRRRRTLRERQSRDVRVTLPQETRVWVHSLVATSQRSS